MHTREDKDIPLFKHISIKWSQKEDDTKRFEITVASSNTDEAVKTLRGIKNHLVKTYGNQVREHFIGDKKESRLTINIPRKRNFIVCNEDWDDDIGDFIKSTNNNNKLSRVLIEGMEIITNQKMEDDRKGALVFQPGEKEREQKNQTRGEQEKITKTDVRDQEEIIEIEDSQDG